MKKLILSLSILALTSCVQDDVQPENDNAKSGRECLTPDCTNIETVQIIDNVTKKPLGQVIITVTWTSGSDRGYGVYYEGEGYDSSGQYYHFKVEWISHPGRLWPIRTVTGRKIPGPNHPK